MVASRFSLTLGPIDLPRPDQLREAVVRLAARGPRARVGLIQADAHHWKQLGEDIAERVDQIVRVPPESEIDLRSWLEKTWLPDLPIQFAVTRNRIAYLCDHRLMDARLATVLPPILCDLARGGDIPCWLDNDTRHPLGAALANTFLRHPSVALQMIRNVRASRSESDFSDEQGARAEPTDAVVSTGVQHIVGVLEQAEVRAIRRWARGRLSFSSAILLLAAGALRAVGAPVAPKGTMVVDLRRYLGGNATTTGNFIGGMSLPVDGPSASPEALEARIRTALNLGQPLASAAFNVLKSKVSGLGRATRALTAHSQTTIGDPAATTVSVSNSGILREVEKMSWLANPTERTVECLGDAVDPAAVGLLTCLVDGRLRVGVSFQGEHHPADQVRSALQLMTQQPVELLAPSPDLRRFTYGMPQ